MATNARADLGTREIATDMSAVHDRSLGSRCNAQEAWASRNAPANRFLRLLNVRFSAFTGRGLRPMAAACASCTAARPN